MATIKSARERFLKQASSNVLDASSPVAAALRHEAILLETLNNRKPEGCQACGHLNLEQQTRTLRRRRGHADLDSGVQIAITKCQTCQRSSKQILDKELSIPQPADSMSNANNTNATNMNTNLRNPTHLEDGKASKISSKKRAKERKGRQGLQAMLEQSRTVASPATPGFSLMDFMSK